MLGKVTAVPTCNLGEVSGGSQPCDKPLPELVADCMQVIYDHMPVCKCIKLPDSRFELEVLMPDIKARASLYYDPYIPKWGYNAFNKEGERPCLDTAVFAVYKAPSASKLHLLQPKLQFLAAHIRSLAFRGQATDHQHCAPCSACINCV